MPTELPTGVLAGVQTDALTGTPPAPFSARHSRSIEAIGRGSDGAARFAWIDVALHGAETLAPEEAERLLARYPSLALHACKHGLRVAGTTPPTFGEVIRGALVPHALEHLTLELLVAAHPGETFAGNTRWLERDKGTMRVRVSWPSKGDASPVFAAFSEALWQLSEILEPRGGQTGQKALS